MKKFVLFCLLAVFFSGVFAQQTGGDSTEEEKQKTGWSFGAVPAIAYDSDIGFKYGGVVNLYDYGDGTVYPKYRHSLYFEWSRTTKGSGINQFTYDSEYLIPKVRVRAEASLLTEKALDFYGFNGYESYYNSDFEQDDNADYKSRMFYRHDRQLGRLKLELQGQILERKLRWYAGWAYYNVKIDSVDIDNLNEGKAPEDQLPYTEELYEKYINWGVIPHEQRHGGKVNYLKAGLIYDTRDNEPNPMTGLWSEAIVLFAPDFMASNPGIGYSRIALTHRQYFTLVPKRLSLAYRLSYQSKLAGEMPYYMLPFIYDTNIARDGLGGAKNLRGILRNRVVGESMLFGNLEFRWKFWRGIIANQNVYLALSAFTDAGTVTGKYDFDQSGVPAEYQNYIDANDESLHISYGAGLHIALNQNFVVAVDYGLAADKRDGNSGLYIGLNFLF